MINWEKSKEQFGTIGPGYRKWVIAICDVCNNESPKLITKVGDIIDGQMAFICRKCMCNTPERRQQASRAGKSLGKNERSRAMKKAWQRHRDTFLAAQKNSRQSQREGLINRWLDPDFRGRVSQSLEGSQKLSEAVQKQWENPNYEKHNEHSYQNEAEANPIERLRSR